MGQQPGPPSRLERLPPLTHPGLLGARPSKVEKASPGRWTVPTMSPFHGGVLRPAAGQGFPVSVPTSVGLGQEGLLEQCQEGRLETPGSVEGARITGSVSRRRSPARGPRPGTGLQARVPAGGPRWPLGLGVTGCPCPPTGPAVRLVTPVPHPLERWFPGLGTKCVWMWKLPGVATAPQTVSDKGLALFCLWGPCSAFWGT